MSRLGDEIRLKIGDRESKELFPGYVEALEPSEKLELSTFVTKLSKLCNGAAEGERYFLDTPARSTDRPSQPSFCRPVVRARWVMLS